MIKYICNNDTYTGMHGHEEKDCPGPEECECHKGEHPHHHMHGPPRRGGMGSILILRLIDEKPMHGYQLMEELNKRGLSQPDRLEPAAIYTALRRMEHRGLLTSQWEEKTSGPDRRIYTITEEGKSILKQSLEMMKHQKAVLDDLTAYYDTHYKNQ
jgi:PadR family transcriptional regulator, regulatory protein PadR